MNWTRIPNPGRMSGGNIWKANSRGMEFAIFKAHVNKKYYLTGALGFMAKPESLGVLNSLAEAKAQAEILK